MDSKDWRQRVPTDLSRRQALVLAVSSVGSSAILLGNNEDRTIGRSPQYDEEIVDAHVNNAAKHFDRNVHLFSPLGESSIEQHYSVDIERVEDNLQAAKEELDLANSEIGDADKPTLVTDAEDYLHYQQLMRNAFDLSGEWTDDGFSDPQLQTAVNSFRDATEANDLTEANDPGQDPYQVDFYHKEFSNIEDSLSFNRLSDHVSHRFDDVQSLVHSGLETISDLSAVHQMLRAHVLLPKLTERVLEIDRELSQSSFLGRIASFDQGEFQELTQQVGMRPATVSSEELLSKQVSGLSASVNEICQSFEQFVTPFDKITESLVALSNGNHTRSTQLWSDATETLFVAYDESPIL